MKNKHLLTFCTAALITSALYSQTCTTPTISNGTVCTGNTYTISNTSSGALAFYSTSMVFLTQANSYTTAPANTTAYNYVAVENVGALSNTIGAGGFYTTTAKTITFNTTTTVLINTIDVYPQNGGSITIAVKNAAGNVVVQTTVSVPSGGLQTIPLGFSIPAGTGYKMELIAESCGGLYRNSAGNAFPYNSPSGIVSLTTTDYGILGYYYYFYNWSVSNSACVNTMTVAISSPTASINASGNALSTGSFGSYQWLLNNTPISGATSQNYIATQSGVYTVSVTNAYGCTAVSEGYTLSISTGLAEKSTMSGHTIYPNPLSGNVLTIDSGAQGNERPLSASIYAINGELVKTIGAEQFISTDPGKYSIYINDIKSGIYLLQLKSDPAVEYQKLIINR